MPGFNEAGAFMPRKVRGGGKPPGGRKSFNEAGAFMPRKGCQRGTGGTGRGASMRPGLLCPGRRSATPRQCFTMSGFNEAGAFMPRKVVACKGELLPLP